MSDVLLGLLLGVAGVVAVVTIACVLGVLREVYRPPRAPAGPTCPVCRRAPIDAAWRPTCSPHCYQGYWEKRAAALRADITPRSGSTWDA